MLSRAPYPGVQEMLRGIGTDSEPGIGTDTDPDGVGEMLRGIGTDIDPGIGADTDPDGVGVQLRGIGAELDADPLFDGSLDRRPLQACKCAGREA